VRQSVRAGAQLLVSAGNDGIFKSPIVAEEQLVMAKLRAIEERRYLVRSMKTGISAIIDPWGREVARVPVQAQALIRGDVFPISRLSFYTRWGDWIVWLAGLLALVGLFQHKEGGRRDGVAEAAWGRVDRDRGRNGLRGR
jgi:apolipoprotein N-acyltransferase